MDTNAVLLPFREGLPLVAEVARWLPGAELAVPSVVLSELDRLVARGSPHAAPARAFAERFRVLPVAGRGDRAVLEAAVRLRATVVTADRAAAARLRACGVAVLVPRDRCRLEIKWPVVRAPDDPRTDPTRRVRA